MQVIDERISFSQPQLLKVTPWAQVIRFKYKASRNAPNISAQDCVLKIFGEDSRILFDKEVAAYARLVQSKTSATYAKPLGYSKWTAQKYERTIGRNITRMGDGKAEVYVLMLEFVVGRELTAKDFTKPLAISCLKSLDQLHALAIVHGDINPSNLLLLEDDSTTDFVWLDFSFSWTDASPAQLDWETDRAVEYLSDWSGIPKSNLFEDAKLTRRITIPGLPQLDEDIQFSDVTYVTEGTHATIYRATVGDEEGDVEFCLKLFREGWMTPFNLEKTAFEHLLAAKATNFIPKVHGYDARTLAGWGLPQDENNSDTLYYGILMEWLSGAECLSVHNITFNKACALLEGLDEIHKAGVLHVDPFRRNQMVFPATHRVAWIDFSCAHMNEEFVHSNELGDVAGTIMELLLERENRKIKNRLIRLFASKVPIFLRISPIAVSIIFTAEGLWDILGAEITRDITGLPRPTYGRLVVGMIKLLVAALIASDATSIHIRTSFFQVLWSVKAGYVLFNASMSMSLLFFGCEMGHLWQVAALPFTMIWFASCLNELLSWNIDSIKPLKVPDITIRSDSGMSSYDEEELSVTETESEDGT